MLVQKIAAMDCEGGNCPNTYATDRGTVVVQGDLVKDNSHAVVVPSELLRRHAAAIGHGNWAGPAEQLPGDRVLVRGRQVTDSDVLQAIGAPANENLIEIGEVVAA
ncbi:hypothetical protein Psed_6814 (plasmid) [Pseudonocardia dioxanivorans CB1190]|uniref:Uncharacterized protein n=1 Tax=Pseudonocardia dioxanivorans (strain ATCC 55486 / DSM 44775 / JCM 13855 / CB1190) TaxID=675635 RepID=F2L6J1_PSEUX|nr:hypothetical protein [Pseudonocardia dioxanivorans]AEA28885.1 hypothetical protein Psed_6814 [Pseudonocardia dioxanivorans CB1190]